MLPGDVGQRKDGQGPHPIPQSRFPPLLLLSTSILVQPCPYLSYQMPGESGKLLPSSQVGPCCREIESGLGVGQAPQLEPAQHGPKVWEPQLGLGHLWAATSVCVCVRTGGRQGNEPAAQCHVYLRGTELKIAPECPKSRQQSR